MKRALLLLSALLVAGFVGPVGLAAAAPGTVAAAPGTATSVRTDLDDFTFSSFDATYTLGLDDDGRSVLTVVETLVADFPDIDQNRGIVRALVDSYDGHPTDLEVISVTDETGADLAYESDSDDGIEELTIRGEEYLRGEHTFVITYEQHNVTRYFRDTGVEEFYWDTNGTDWAQPFGRVSATVILEPDVLARATGAVDAAQGAEGSTDYVEAVQTDDGYTFTATDLGPGENVSFAIGFEPGTFEPRDDSFGAAPWPLLSLLGALGAIGSTVGAFLVRRRYLQDALGRPTIIAEYLPPKNASLLVSSVISGTTAKSTTAEILELAVAGYLRIVEVPAKRKPTYALEFITADGAGVDDLEFLHALFGAELTPGESRDLKKPDSKTPSRISSVMTKVSRRVTADGYRRKLPAGKIALASIAVFVFAIVATVFGAISLAQSFGGPFPGIFVGIGAVAIVVAMVLLVKYPLEAKGAELRDHLRGLKLYISLAEADRIRFLQSPEGALREQISTDDPAQVLRLNERLLPYAVLFGEEKKWVRELGEVYDRLGQQPTWYYGNAPFNAAYFSTTIGAISTSVSSSYSSSGGSGGGASSGGGGGGGGGGGA